MRQIAESAWECADPGMQFDTTINRWHTAANTGRINASNPCSEYMHIDNSACNLASINLLKYLERRRHLRRRGVQAHDRGRVHRAGDPRRQRRLPDREDRRQQPGVPSARPGLRQPRRAADGAGHAVRLRRRPAMGRGDHRADDRPRVRDERTHRGTHGPVRGLRGEPGADAEGAAHAPGRHRADRRSQSVPAALRRRGPHRVGRSGRARRAARRAQLAGVGARAHGHDRPDDGLRHDRHRARPRAHQGEEARRRRHDVHRQPDRSRVRCASSVTTRPRRRRSSPTSTSTRRSSGRRRSRPSTCPCSRARWATTRSTTWAT